MRAYHDATKHHFTRFARSAGYLDWATQPDPFRRFEGSPLVDLVRPLTDGHGGRWQHVTYPELFEPVSAPRVPPGPEAVSVLLRYGLGLSAWKSAGGSRWPLRVNPSSGNLHPTEAYIVSGPGVAGEAAGVFHYRPDLHALERRCAVPHDAWIRLSRGLPPGSFLAALSSIHWREAWKYGERAFRYCQHDTGHAIAALRVSAAMMGWHLRVEPSCSSAALERLLGLDRDADFGDAEREDPECLLVVTPSPAALWPSEPLDALASPCAVGEWTGRANRLSPSRVIWDAIDGIAAATRDPGTAGPPAQCSESSDETAGPRPDPMSAPPASRLLLQRRSAVAMSGGGTLAHARFTRMLRQLMPGARPPWDALWWHPYVHLLVFVHRVEGLEPGLYVLARSPHATEVLTQSTRADFAWVHAPSVPEDLPLHLLVPADVQRLAGQLSCGQAIAADGYFSVGMVAEFHRALAEHGPWFYRPLFWETGVLGQVLYLEAEAAGARGTGIGCFFDDAVHELLGVAGHTLQSLYHFTVGEPVEDARLGTEPGYEWETSAPTAVRG